MWVQIGDDYLNLDNLADRRQGMAEEGDLTATAETTSGRAHRYTGEDALTFREALVFAGQEVQRRADLKVQRS
jgi:hypothetical protein